MRRLKQVALWTFLLNKRILKQPLFLFLIAMVPILVFGVGQLSRESSSLVTAAIAPGSPDDETAREMIDSLVDGSTSAVRYLSCSNKEEVLDAIAKGHARIGFILPKDLNALFEAYGSQETKNLSEGALVMLGALLGGDTASEEMKANAIESYAATNDVVSKLTREQLFGKLYPSLQKAVLKTWLKIHPEVGTMSNEEREQFVEDSIAAYEQEYDFFNLEYMDGTPVKDEEINRYIASPMRGLLAALLTLTGFAAILYLTEDCRKGRFVWIPVRLQAPVHFLYLMIPLLDVALAVLVALIASGNFTDFIHEVPTLILLVFQIAGFSNLMRVLLRRKSLMASSIPILISACLFLTPVFVDLSIIEPLQMLLPPYLYLKSIHGNLSLWYMVVYAATASIVSILADSLIPPRS